MKPNWRHVLLFLVALLLPCLVLVALGVAMIGQGRELAETRQTEETRRLIGQVGGELMARLERIKLEEAGALAAGGSAVALTGPRHPEVALVGWIRDGRLLLPWDVDPAAERFRRMLTGTLYAHAIEIGEEQEGAEFFTQAGDSYRRAKSLSQDAGQSDYADLLRARAMVKEDCDCATDVRRLYLALLASDAVDDQGIPIALYAADRLAGEPSEQARILDLIDRRFSHQVWLAPAAVYFERALLGRFATGPEPGVRDRASDLLSRVQTAITSVEQALALQRDFFTFMPAAGAAGVQNDPVWITFGQSPWLVSQAPSLAGLPPLAIAVRAEPVFKAIESSMAAMGRLHFSTTQSSGQLLGAGFPGLRASLVAPADGSFMKSWQLQRTFYIFALLSVLSVTLAGGYALWRNVQRELRLAELRSQFVSSVSHELRTPLTAIRMFAETLQMGRPLDARTQAEYLSTIVNESERLTRLLDNVLDFSKIERDQKVYKLEPAALAPVLRDAAVTMRYPLAHQGFQLNLDVTDDRPRARIDKDAIEQAVLNLLSNAMKYSGASRTIDLRLVAVNGHAVIEVRDYGLGIAPAEHGRIFQRFYRASVPENFRIPGTGLGLALVEHIVAGHGGRVEVKSAPGEGSTFAIHLPVETSA